MRNIAIVVATLLSASLSSCRTPSTAGSEVLEAPSGSTQCAGFDAVPDGQDPGQWLIGISQSNLEKVFDCAPASTKTPIGFGKGLGSVFQAWPLWNNLQTKIGSYIWGGKRLFEDERGTHLLNKMVDSGDERYKADVYVTTSIRDGRTTVVLDYRNDDSSVTLGGANSPAQKVVDEIVRGIRDEIREVYQNGQGTGVFVGRAHLLKRVFLAPPGTLGMKVTVDDQEFENKDSWMLAANFFLDFRGN